ASSKVTGRPACASRTAADRPSNPPPTMTTLSELDDGRGTAGLLRVTLSLLRGVGTACERPALGLDEFVSFGMNRQHRTGGFAYDFFRRAAHQHVGDGTSAVCAHDDQIDLLIARVADGFDERSAHHDRPDDAQLLVPLRAGQSIQFRLGAAADVFF